MPKLELPSVYQPNAVEPKWYSFWEERGYFHAQVPADRSPARYCITIPPPNVTGELHMGHAVQHAIHDMLIRWQRMLGKVTLCLPGTDHAGIPTQMKVEAALAEEGLSRQQLGREAFLERMWQWTEQYGGAILRQLRALGCSYDWGRERFTLDPGYQRAVLAAFLRFYRRGWIYRGPRVVNWCPSCHTTISDLEVEHRESWGRLWHIRYPAWGASPPWDESNSIVVATTRPETMLGDTAVAVHPDDSRYRRLQGRSFRLPLLERMIPLVEDPVLVDPEFGTGAVKVTPAHDPNDFTAGQRNSLPSVVVIGKDGRMTEEAGRYAGMDRTRAREAVLQDLEAQGLLVKTEEYLYAVGHHDKCATVIEPLLSDQWFLKMGELAALARQRLEKGEVDYLPERFLHYTLQWLDEVRDWNISRQIWWGHRIPVWWCARCGQPTPAREVDGIGESGKVKGEGTGTASHLSPLTSHLSDTGRIEPPAACACCGGELEQDPDVLDTWFSSALWPLAVLGWPQQTLELDYFYPTDLLITGRDILYLWVVRMVMASAEFTGKVPFRRVLVHPTILTLEGRRMSKSLGTGVDPMELIRAYGADATRFGLVYQCASGQDVRFSQERIEMSRNFCNKLWNASRLVLMNLTGDEPPPNAPSPDQLQQAPLADRWIFSRLSRVHQEVEESLSEYRLDEAARALYQWFWGDFCDWYLEMAKLPLREGGQAADRTRNYLIYLLSHALALLHPIIPFITEEIWQQLPHRGESLMTAPWPVVGGWLDNQAEEEMAAFQGMATAIRRLRAEAGLAPSRRVQARAWGESGTARAAASHCSDALAELTRAVSVSWGKLESPAGWQQTEVTWDDLRRGREAVLTGVDDLQMSVAISVERTAEEVEEERRQIEKQLDKLQEQASRLEARLADRGFLERAPRQAVEASRAQLEEVRTRRGALERRLEELGEVERNRG